MNTRNLYDYTISEKTLINNPVFSHRQICVYQKSYMTFERLYTCFRTLSELFPYSHPRACFYYCYSHPRVQRVLDIHRFPGQASSPSVIADLIFLTVIPRLNRGIQEIPGSRYACPRMTEEKIIHAGSNAFQQMFAPLPMLRSSWPQLVMFGLCFSLQSYSGLSRTSKHRRHAERVTRVSKK